VRNRSVHASTNGDARLDGILTRNGILITKPRALKTPTTYLFLITVIALCGCRGLKYATAEKPLFAGYDVHFIQSPEADAAAAQTELENVVEPKPNNSIFGMRPTVALYNMTKEPKREGKGLRNLLKYKIGSKPVYFDEVPLKDIDAALANRMNNRGYFSATTRHETKSKGRTATVDFFVTPGRVHRMNSIAYTDSSRTVASIDTLEKHIEMAKEKSPIKPGDPYHLAALINERTRVADELRNMGFYRFKDDDLEFAADTTVGDHLVDMRLRVKLSTGDNERTRYRMSEVYVHGDHDDLLAPNDTFPEDSLKYINYLNMFRPSTITRGVFLHAGNYYSQLRTDQTKRYLGSYGTFRTVQVDFRDDSTKQAALIADVLLTPQKRFSLFTELNATSKSNNFAGPGIKVGFKDRDLLRGAELLTVDLNGRFESQLAGQNKGTNAYEIGIKASLVLPRLALLPFLRSARYSVPSTRIDVGYGLFRRIGLYGLESISGAYSYVWRYNTQVWHDLKVLDISYNNLYYASDIFNTFLDSNPTIRRSFDEQFIVGLGYTYTRTSQRSKADLSWWLLSVGADESGNIISGVNAISGPRPDDGYTLFGERYSQFVRFRPEVRWFQRIGNKGAQIASRILASVAVPFGNSSVTPYVKQFYSGGTNSLRAFRARGVGPGTYSPSVNSDGPQNLLIDQVGDIKFEANLEYRWVIGGPIKAAIFADAGNVWLLNEDPQRPGGQFNWNTALDELAVGAGLGLRFDPEVIVIRLDLATPLRRPDLPKGDRWVFNDQAPELTNNFILNIAIGYPF